MSFGVGLIKDYLNLIITVNNHRVDRSTVSEYLKKKKKKMNRTCESPSAVSVGPLISEYPKFFNLRVLQCAVLLINNLKYLLSAPPQMPVSLHTVRNSH